IDRYHSQRLGKSAPEDSAWVCHDNECRVLGFLAQRQNFIGSVRLDERKYERAAWTVAVLVGSIAQKHDLPSTLLLHLSSLLPYSEWNDIDKFKRLCEKILAEFEFRGVRYQVSLGEFDCKPEGGGLGLVRQAQIGAAEFRRSTMVVIMLGHRDASALVLQRGELTKGSTSKIGFTRLTSTVSSYVSINHPERLTSAIYQAGDAMRDGSLRVLADDDEDLQRLKQSIDTARRDYWQAIKTWLETALPLVDDVQYAVIGGGAAAYLLTPIKKYFKTASVSWTAELEAVVRETFSQSPEIKADPSLAGRLTDAYALFCQFQKKVAARQKHQEVAVR
ncbi:MAG TPA: hypothetical protein VL134_04580, partial [Leptolyngbya sp.]|nr:hypothetical protein [Leptolyngbya sp.]